MRRTAVLTLLALPAALLAWAGATSTGDATPAAAAAPAADLAGLRDVMWVAQRIRHGYVSNRVLAGVGH